MPSILQVILWTILAGLLAVIQYYSFGSFILSNLLAVKPRLARFVLSWILGITFTSLALFLLGSVFGQWTYFLGLLFFVVGLLNIRKPVLDLFELIAAAKKEWLFSVFLVTSALSLAATLIMTWIRNGDTLYLQAGQLHDSVWHLAVIQKALDTLPPEHPASYLYSIENYHYLYDITIAVLIKIFKLPLSVVYFQVFPLIITFLLACSSILLFPLKTNRLAAYVMVFLTFFGGSFAYLIPYFIPGNSWQESSFWVSQTFAVLVNPQLIFSFSIALALVWLVRYKNELFLKTRFRHLLLLTVLTASLAGFKSYGWLLCSLFIGIDLFFELLIEKKRIAALIRLLVFTTLNLLFFYLILGFQTSSFIYAPLWYLSSMVEAPDRVNNPVWKLLELHYIANHKLHRLIELKVKEFLIFFSGNLGTRVLFVFFPLLWLSKSQRSWRNVLFWLEVCIAFVFAAGIPLFVLQKNGPVWNSIQFWYYALIFANLLAAVFVEKLIKLIKYRFLQLLFICIIVVATLPTFVRTMTLKYTEYEKIPAAKIDFIVNKLERTDRILICPNGSQIYGTSLISALTGAHIYLANPVQIELMFGEQELPSEKQLRSLFSPERINSGELLAFLKENKISKVVCADDGVNNHLSSLPLFMGSRYNEVGIYTYVQ